ncbi:hypothetical protein evm_015280 [Chilo suppressalis]|nr:hypothetical protein evm_015280 [Chilo suppressalis]
MCDCRCHAGSNGSGLSDLVHQCECRSVVLGRHLPCLSLQISMPLLAAGIIWTTSRFGKPVIQIGRRRYNMYHKCRDKDKVRWVCTRTGSGCRATIITVNDDIIKIIDEHNHD